MTDDGPDEVRGGRVVESIECVNRIEACRLPGWCDRGGVGMGHRARRFL